MRSDRVDATRIDARLVRTLLAQQFPAWQDRPVRLVERGGNDHRMFRLGDDLSVRLPSPPGYVAQVVRSRRGSLGSPLCSSACAHRARRRPSVPALPGA